MKQETHKQGFHFITTEDWEVLQAVEIISLAWFETFYLSAENFNEAPA